MNEIRLYGPIDGFNDISSKLREVESGTVKIYIDSPGGNVFTGFSIISAIQEIQKKGIKVEVHVESIAASMAAIIAVMADHTTMNSYAQIMIHSASGVVQTEEDMDVLKNINNALTDIVSKRTGLSTQKIKNWLKKDTWFDAESALDNGLIDEILNVKEKVEALYKIESIREIYKNNESESLVADFAAIYDESFKIETETKIMLDKLQALLPDVTEDNFEDKIQNLLDIKSDYEAKIKDFEAEITGFNTEIENQTAQIEELSNKLSVYLDAEKEAQKVRVEELVDSAIENRKISADTRDVWLEFANENYDKTKTILGGISVNPKLHELASQTEPTNKKSTTAHDAYVAELAKKQSKF